MEVVTDMSLDRKIYTDNSTIGDISFECLFECNSLEDTCRRRDINLNGRLDADEKVYGKTAIPSGRYEIKMCWSAHFQRKMPHLHSDWVCCTGEEMPGKKYLFKDVMIHWGNSPENVLGCIATGSLDKKHPDWVNSSQKAYNDLEPKILRALWAGRLFLSITGGYTA